MAREILVTVPLVEELKKLASAMLGPGGREYVNPLPMHIDVTPRPPTLQEQIQRLLRVELAAQAKSQGNETFEEFTDFDVDDDPEILSGYEVHEMVDEVPHEAPGPESDPKNPTEELENNEAVNEDENLKKEDSTPT